MLPRVTIASLRYQFEIFPVVELGVAQAEMLALASRAARESDGVKGRSTRGSPLEIGQPRARFFDTVGVVN